MSSEPFQQKSPIKIRLPLPYLSTYYLERTAEGRQSYRLRKDDSVTEGKPFPKALHADDLVFSKIPAVESDKIPDSDNREYARARRSPVWSLSWEKQTPTLAQTWMFLYTFFTYHFD
ncbi:hypothetical protein FOXB_13434, partial [Fusarium oxysporum f. sp. conglutinans Fo5176]